MKTTFDTLPQQIDFLLAEVLNIKEVLLNRLEKPEEIPKYLTMESALSFLRKRAYPMSKSKMYKLTSSSGIPYRKMGNKLLFCSNELEQWCNDQVENRGDSKPFSNVSIIKSAQNN